MHFYKFLLLEQDFLSFQILQSTCLLLNKCLHKLGPSFHLVFLFTCIYAQLHVSPSLTFTSSHVQLHWSLGKFPGMKIIYLFTPFWQMMLSAAYQLIGHADFHFVFVCDVLFFNLKKKLHGDLECLEMCYTTFNRKWLLMFLKSVKCYEKQYNSKKKNNNL